MVKIAPLFGAISRAALAITVLLVFCIRIHYCEKDIINAEAGHHHHDDPSETEPVVKVDTDPTLKCNDVSMNSEWDKQKQILPCHYYNTTHPRMEPRKRRTDQEKEDFHALALFNIKYDLDFQEAGEKCSTRLQNEWINAEKGPMPLTEFSYNRIWYKRLCNFFSYLECVPSDETRSKQPLHSEGAARIAIAAKTLSTTEAYHDHHETHQHAGALPDSHGHLDPESEEVTEAANRTNYEPKLVPTLLDKPDTQMKFSNFRPPLKYADSNLSTTGLVRLKIGGRGPGKGRHKSGPGGRRVQASELGPVRAYAAESHKLDGVCTCSTKDPAFPNRKRADYGMDFVEDEARPRWCVAAPGNLCGRVYFRKEIWPGQVFEMSDHIGCPKKYLGEEYECVRWQLVSNKEEDEAFKQLPNTMTSTCERKRKDSEIEEEKKKMMNSKINEIESSTTPP